MQVGSLVEYIGGQDQIAKRICSLQRNTPYTIHEMGEAEFARVGKQGALVLEEKGRYWFRADMFAELQPPMTISLEALIEEPETVTQ